jgi:hypothetical protein
MRICFTYEQPAFSLGCAFAFHLTIAKNWLSEAVQFSGELFAMNNL